jgi:hypothetical protein
VTSEKPTRESEKHAHGDIIIITRRTKRKKLQSHTDKGETQGEHGKSSCLNLTGPFAHVSVSVHAPYIQSTFGGAVA